MKNIKITIFALCVAILGILISCFPFHAQKSSNLQLQQLMAVRENLKLRAGESTSTNVIAIMAVGDKVKILETGKSEKIDGINSSWVKVEVQSGAKDLDGKSIPAGTVGWCYGGYLLAIGNGKLLVIPDGTKNIESNAFYNNKEITSVIIPNSVTSIESWAFSYCSNLAYISIPNSVKSIGEYAFGHCSGLTSIILPNSVTTIGDGAFSLCSNLISILIPNSVISIGDNVFEECLELTDAAIPKSVKSIGNCAFLDCGKLKNITISNGTESIGQSAFSYCTGLTSIMIPESVKSIGTGAFSGCSSLESVAVVEENNVYDSRNGCNAIIETKTNTLIAGCKNTVIPDSVTAIGGCAFQGQSGLTSITIPNGVTSIDFCAFYGCSGLKNFTIPDGVKFIGYEAFFDCTDLTSITIPESVTEIDVEAFLVVHDTYGTDHYDKTLASIIFKDTSNWYAGDVAIDSASLSNLSTATSLLTSKYAHTKWIKR